MAQQSDIPMFNHMLSGNPPEFCFQENLLGGSAMSRDHLSSQSSNSQSTRSSDWTDETADSTTTWDPYENYECMQYLKPEPNMSYNSDSTYGGQFPSPVTEQADSFGEMSLYYPQTVDDRSLTIENSSSHGMKYRMQDTQPMSRSNSYSNSPSFLPPIYLPTNNQRAYGVDQIDEKHTPKSLGWPKQTDLVDKYKLILLKENSYLKILRNSDISYDTPAKVYLDVEETMQKGSVRCQWPGECARDDIPFTRQADCARHMKNVHGPLEGRDKFCCTYNPCLNKRHLDEHAFSRKDHCRDHYKDYHMEDIGAARGQKEAKTEKQKHAWEKKQAEWIAARNISPLHWRCARCLTKVWVSKHGWTCSTCNSQCELERIAAREKLPRKEQSPARMGSGGVTGSSSQPQLQYQYQDFERRCPLNCDEDGWILVTSLTDTDWNPCPYHRPNEGQIGAKSFR